ncbi:uncharacterized protein DFL_001147 [Arthrobotrys flagrans]|uniref:CENP-T/Histone H4 histone fold domain-containing protein n=1 Tax=Arthrobotrys flagrans TaxID=97331 RepID=A0A437AGB8_ARTFL|nr:hypothetical protein DFL_001147 [Arthrobotrys flagrans]
MSDPDSYNIFAPKNALRRTPPTDNKPPSRGPTPLRSTPRASSPKGILSRDVSPLREPQRPMTSPLRNLDSDDIDGPQTQPTPTTTSRHLRVSITPRASTVEPVTPSFVRPASSIPNTSVRRRLTTPHAIRGYSNRPTPHKNQGKRRNSRFAAEDDDIFQALKQFSKITAPKSKPFIPTPKAITPKAVSERRQTLKGIRLHRDLNAVSSDEEADPIRPPRLSNVSLRLIGKRLTIKDNHEAEEDDDVEISPPPQLSTPLRDSGDDDDLKSGGIETPRFEVARRAVGENDRRFSFLPNMGDRFADFGDVVMDDSIVQEAGGQHIAEVFEGESFAVDGDGMEGLSFADRTVDLNAPEGDVSGFFNAQGMGIPDDETDFRLEQVEISPPSELIGVGEETGDLPEITNEISSPPPPRTPPADDTEPVFVGSDFDDEEDDEDDDGPPPFQPDDNNDLRSTVQPRPTKKPRGRKELPLSAHGIPYPSLSTKAIKSIIARTSKQKISKEALAMIASASEAYFENLGEDLGSFAKHAKRKTVEEGDVLQVLRRHRLLNDKTTVFSLANQYLPRELLQDIKIQVPRKNLPKQRRRRGVDDSMADETIEEE